MNKFADYCVGVVKEGKRVRWPKGKAFTEHVVTVLSYMVFFAVWLVLCYLFVAWLLQLANFN